MKNTFLLLVLGTTILSSCSKKPSITEVSKKDTTQVTVKIDSLAFEVDTFRCVEAEDPKLCPKGDCGGVDLYYERIRTPLKPVHDSVNMYIDSTLMDGLSWMGGKELKYDLKKRALAFFASKREMEDEEFATGAWDWQLQMNIYRPCNEIFTVSSGWGGYTGGAHPNYESFTANFFTSTGRRVTMNDLFTDLDAVNKIGVKYFKKDNGLEPGADCSEGGWDFTDETFSLNENFDINTESITWQFNSYEIGPYVAGAPSVTIPMNELKKYLKVKFTDVVIQ